MVDRATSLAITQMKHPQAIDDRAVVQFPHQSVNEQLLAPNRHMSIPTRTLSSGPQHAGSVERAIDNLDPREELGAKRVHLRPQLHAADVPLASPAAAPATIPLSDDSAVDAMLVGKRHCKIAGRSGWARKVLSIHRNLLSSLAAPFSSGRRSAQCALFHN
jgi:hypothetical protein